MKSPIGFHSVSGDFDLKKKAVVRSWLERVMSAHHYYPGQVDFIYCSDNYLLEINKEYLSHDDFTDIITFNYNIGQQISGDIFISVDRVTENAADLNLPFEKELARVMIHGVLHLLGYNDKSPEEQEKMRTAEDYYMQWLESPLHVSRGT
jgi:probable rRNA maturation factor